MSHYLIFKPYGMLSQFTKEAPHHVTLADLDYSFEKDVYPIGRLDADSEGLLLLSNDKSLNQKILHPLNKQPKTYWAQVEGIPTALDLKKMSAGVDIKVDGKLYHTLPSQCKFLNKNVVIGPRNPPIRVRKNIPDTWISIEVVEGKNRQVRKMCAAIGFPCLRLIRSKLLHFDLTEESLQSFQPGGVMKVDLQGFQ